MIHSRPNDSFGSRTCCRHSVWIPLRKLLWILAIALVANIDRCAAQTVIYPQLGYPANPYPATTYPTNTYPEISYPAGTYPIGSYPIQTQAVSSYPVRQPQINRDPIVTSTPIETPSQPMSGRVTTTISQPIPVIENRPAKSPRSMVITDRPEKLPQQRATFETASNSDSKPITRLASRRIVRPDRYAVSNDHRYDLINIESARRAANGFQTIADTAAPIVADIALDNAVYADQWANLAEDYNDVSRRVRAANESLQSTAADLEDVRDKLDHFGLTPTIGLLLRSKKEQLDRWQANDTEALLVNQELDRARAQQLELEMVRYDGSEPTVQAGEILIDAGYDARRQRNQELFLQLERLLEQRFAWLDSLRKAYQDYQRKLGELDTATSESSELAADYRRLIDRHIVWIRSGDPVDVDDVRNLKGGLAAFFSTRRSGDLGYSIERKWRADSGSGVGLLATILVSLLLRMWAKSWLIGIGRQIRMKESSADSRKLFAGILTIVVAIALPSILYLIGRWLGSGVVTEATLHAAAGCYAAALVALLVEVPRQLLRTHGYVDKHVEIDLPRRGRAATYLTLVGFGLVLAAYVITWMGLMDRGMWRDSVARFGFIAAMLLATWTAHLALRPSGGFLEPWIAKFGGRVIHRLRLVLYLVGVAFPLAMIGLAALGYGFTANEIVKRMMISTAAVMIAATLWAGVKIASAHLWYLLTRAPESSGKRSTIGAARPHDDQTPQVTGVLGEHFLELKHQIAFLCQCALVVGALVSLGWLWVDVFPNARIANPVLWTVTESVTMETADLNLAGPVVEASMMESTPITAMHLLLAFATIFVAFQIAKLLPALFDALVLQRVSFDEGMEHFSLVLGRCILFGIGCLIATRLVGLRWQTIQWLAVGLTIGLGFGLQDMVRNLFGGFIVLFEKPARLGDFISVGKVTGRVAAQRLRTTVLSDDDGREVIIPNKNFVNEEVVNWMGAGRLNVIPMEVAVTRDQRPADICRTLQELVIDQDDVLLTPAPQATLVCVGKHSQRIEIRAWIERGQNADMYRDRLLKVVKDYLREEKLLVSSQPSQPSIDTNKADADELSYRRRSSRGRKRSA